MFDEFYYLYHLNCLYYLRYFKAGSKNQLSFF